jgi:hypothetical protein
MTSTSIAPTGCAGAVLLKMVVSRMTGATRRGKSDGANSEGFHLHPNVRRQTTRMTGRSMTASCEARGAARNDCHEPNTIDEHCSSPGHARGDPVLPNCAQCLITTDPFWAQSSRSKMGSVRLLPLRHAYEWRPRTRDLRLLVEGRGRAPSAFAKARTLDARAAAVSNR